MRPERDPDHPIVSRPWECEIVFFAYHRDLEDWRESSIEIHLQRGQELCRLRFQSPQFLRITPGFPQRTGGFCILDVSARQLEGLTVHVADFEAGGGEVDFWAASVELA